MRTFLTKTLILALTALSLATCTHASEPETKASASVPTRSVKLPRKLSVASEALCIRLNSATRVELQRLPGVGPATVQAILDYRTDNKGFADVRELQNVRGIGRKRFMKLASFVRL